VSETEVDYTRIEDRAALLIAASTSNIRVDMHIAAILLAEAPGTFRQLAAKPGFPQPEIHAKRLKWWSQDLREWGRGRRRAA
jgi:hypothetical protein